MRTQQLQVPEHAACFAAWAPAAGEALSDAQFGRMYLSRDRTEGEIVYRLSEKRVRRERERVLRASAFGPTIAVPRSTSTVPRYTEYKERNTCSAHSHASCTTFASHVVGVPCVARAPEHYSIHLRMNRT